MEQQPEFTPELLRMYYARVFPYNHFFRWLSYGHDPSSESTAVEKDFLSKREFSFTMEGDIYIRYLSFRDENDIRSWIQKKQPHKIDIGAMYTYPPDQKTTVKAGQFYPESRELVFDIDVTDYDLVKETIWNGTSMSARIWPFMAATVKVVHRALKEDFGFKHIFWVYSGRRGIHCWVCDKAARDLTDQARSAVAEYLSVEMGNENNRNKINLNGTLHPMLQMAFEELEPMFASSIASEEGQGLLCEESRWNKLLQMVPHSGIREKLSTQWARRSDESTPEEKWEQIKEMVNDELEKHSKKRMKTDGAPQLAAQLGGCIRQIVFFYLYPRLDVAVSTHRNHLLKSPFCIHPKTGRVCVPLDPETVETFNPETVPSLLSLSEEINQYDATHEETDIADWKKTSMKPVLDYYEKAFLKPMHNSIRSEFREKTEITAAATGDW